MRAAEEETSISEQIGHFVSTKFESLKEAASALLPTLGLLDDPTSKDEKCCRIQLCEQQVMKLHRDFTALKAELTEFLSLSGSQLHNSREMSYIFSTAIAMDEPQKQVLNQLSKACHDHEEEGKLELREIEERLLHPLEHHLTWIDAVLTLI